MKDEKLIKFNAFRQLCLKNAEAFLDTAELLLNRKVNHILYHLSLLALEEIGNIFIAWMQITYKEAWDKDNLKIAMDDHVKKLFYSIWAPSIGSELITQSQLSENKLMATTLHEKRIYSLYGNINDTIESSLKISNEEAQSIINFSKARLKLAQINGEVKEEVEFNPDMDWLERFMQIPEKYNYVFGREAQQKLIEIGDVNEWILWMKTSFETEQKTLGELTKQELKRIAPTYDKIKPKWEITFTIITPSHSIRANILTTVNKLDHPIKLFAGKDKHTLIIKNVLGTNVRITELWNYGWLTCKLFVAALNISANGIFYWNTPTNIDKFHDYITDLENDKKLDARLETKLTLNWKDKKMYLTEQNLHLAFLVYEYLIQLGNTNHSKPITEYISGLGMLAKTDIHLRLEVSAFLIFYNAFCEAIKIHEQIIDDANLIETGFSQIEKMLKQRNEFDRTIKLAKQLLQNELTSEPITLKEVIAMKHYCEVYFLTIAVRDFKKDNSLRLVPIEETI